MLRRDPSSLYYPRTSHHPLSRTWPSHHHLSLSLSHLLLVRHPYHLRWTHWPHEPRILLHPHLHDLLLRQRRSHPHDHGSSWLRRTLPRGGLTGGHVGAGGDHLPSWRHVRRHALAWGAGAMWRHGVGRTADGPGAERIVIVSLGMSRRSSWMLVLVRRRDSRAVETSVMSKRTGRNTGLGGLTGRVHVHGPRG